MGFGFLNGAYDIGSICIIIVLTFHSPAPAGLVLL